jgi:hypothetical protein
VDQWLQHAGEPAFPSGAGLIGAQQGASIQRRPLTKPATLQLHSAKRVLAPARRCRSPRRRQGSAPLWLRLHCPPLHAVPCQSPPAKAEFLPLRRRYREVRRQDRGSRSCCPCARSRCPCATTRSCCLALPCAASALTACHASYFA